MPDYQAEEGRGMVTIYAQAARYLPPSLRFGFVVAEEQLVKCWTNVSSVVDVVSRRTFVFSRDT